MKRLTACLVMLLPLVAAVPSPALERLGMGMEPPQFSLPTPEGTNVSLDFFQGGPGVIVFWSTWSPRSAEVLGDFRDFQARGGARGLKVLAVNADRERFSAADREAVTHEVERLQLPFPVVFDEGLRAYAAYGVMALPSTVVLGADGRIAYSLAGYPLTYREELQDRVQLALIGAQPAATAAATETAPTATDARTACVLPRARSCRFETTGESGSTDSGVAAMRLAVCRGGVDGAERLMPAIGMGRFDRPDVRFAVAELLLLKGGTAEARMAFDSLQKRYPGEAWGDWGLGIIALADGREHDALEHMRRAASLGDTCVEAETAVLQYLQGFWEGRRQAATEQGFLAIFAKLGPVRECFARQRLPG